MTSIRKYIAFAGLILVFQLALSACDQDPFNLQYREISNGIYLHQWEDGKTFYLDTKDTMGLNGGGFLEGTVTNIGWNNQYIVANKDPIYQGDPKGWYLINITTKKLEGPIPESDLEKILKSNKIKILSVSAAWNKLG